MLPTPTEMIDHLDGIVHGQKQAKRDLAVSVYNHYLGIADSELSAPGDARTGNSFGKQHVLLMGPTGTGKSFLIQTLATWLSVPVAFCTATSYVQAGYKGKLVEDMIRLLLDAAGNEVERAQRGIIFIDEIDKIRGQETGGSIDVSGTGVQNSLLTLLDGRLIEGVDTGRVLFIATGAFVDLAEIVRKRMQSANRSLGFHPPASDDIPKDLDKTLRSEFAALCNVEHEDLVAFGYIPEFIGRFAVLSAVRELSPSELVAILTETENSIIAKQKRLFALHEIHLEFDEEALDAIAEKAENLRTGARALTRIVLEVLDPVDWRLPELMKEGVRLIRITRETVLDGKAPEMEREAGADSKKSPPEDERIVEGDSAESSDEESSWENRLEKLRRKAIPESLKTPREEHAGSSRKGSLPAGITDVGGMSDVEILSLVERREEEIGWGETAGSARRWWNAFRGENTHRWPLVLRLAEELVNRKATITEFFLAYFYSGVANIQANLHYLDYVRLKRKEEKRKKEARVESARVGAGTRRERWDRKKRGEPEADVISELDESASESGATEDSDHPYLDLEDEELGGAGTGSEE